MPKQHRYEHAPSRASTTTKTLGVYYNNDKPRTLRPHYNGGTLHVGARVIEFDGAQRMEFGYVLVINGEGKEFKRWAYDWADVESGMVDGFLGGLRKLLKGAQPKPIPEGERDSAKTRMESVLTEFAEAAGQVPAEARARE